MSFNIEEMIATAVQEAVSNALKGVTDAQSVSSTLKAPVAKKVTIAQPDDPATFRQRRFIAALSGVFPTDEGGYTGLTKGQAGKAIDALQQKGTVRLKGKTLNRK